MPMWVRRLAQVVSGCCIGAGITRDQIFQLRQLILPALVLIAGYILVCVGMGRAISRAFRMDLKESMLSLSPAGATEMALIAADLGVHSTNLVVLPDMPPAWSDGHLSPDLRPALQFDRIKYAVPASIGGRHSFSAEQKDRPVINLPVWA